MGRINTYNTSRAMDYFGTILYLVVMATSSNIICLTLTNSTSTTKVAFWCDKPISNDSKLEVDNLVAKLNSDFNTSLVLEIFDLNFSTNHVHETLKSLENYSKDDTAFVVSTLSIKDTWFWSTLLSQRNSMIIDIRNSVPTVEFKREVSILAPNFSAMHLKFSVKKAKQLRIMKI